jgi:hypothetical protein
MALTSSTISFRFRFVRMWPRRAEASTGASAKLSSSLFRSVDWSPL